MSLQTADENASSQQVFDALADPKRRTIIELLASNGQLSATEIYENFDISNPAVSQHLRILREARLVEVEKDAQKHLYSLNPGGMRVLEEWIRRTTSLWDERFERLDNVLEVEKKRTPERR